MRFLFLIGYQDYINKNADVEDTRRHEGPDLRHTSITSRRVDAAERFVTLFIKLIIKLKIGIFLIY